MKKTAKAEGKVITGTVKTWLPSYYSRRDLERSPDQVVAFLGYSATDMTEHGWTIVGEARITVTLLDERTIVQGQVDVLRAEQAKVRADATAKATELERKIQQLLAIDYTRDEAAA